MNLSKELNEVVDEQIKLKNMADEILDFYKNNPNECSKLLIEVNEINKELEELEKEILNFM